MTPTSELTAAQVAARYGVTTATVYGWCRRGLIAAIKQGRRWVIDSAVTADLPTEQSRVALSASAPPSRATRSVSRTSRPT